MDEPIKALADAVKAHMELLEEVDTGNEAELRAVVAQAYGIVRAHQHMVMGVLRTAPGEEVEGSAAAQLEGTTGADAVS